MISLALIILSLALIFTAKMPLVGGKTIKDKKVRLGGLLMLAISGFSLFAETKINLLLNSLVILVVVSVYFFIKGGITEKVETEGGLFTSESEEKKTYSKALLGLLIALTIIILFIVGVFLLLKIISGG